MADVMKARVRHAKLLTLVLAGELAALAWLEGAP